MTDCKRVICSSYVRDGFVAFSMMRPAAKMSSESSPLVKTRCCSVEGREKPIFVMKG